MICSRLLVPFLVLSSSVAMVGRGANDDAGRPREKQQSPSDVTGQLDLEEPVTGDSARGSHAGVSALANMTIEPANRWESGEVSFSGQWVAPEEVARLVDTDPSELEYRERRMKSPESATGHFKLAQWCRSRGLTEQQRAHFMVAAQMDPADPRAFKALGLVQHNGAWMSDSEIVAARSRQKEVLKAHASWRTKLLGIRQGLMSSDSVVQQASESELRQIRDPLAILAMEELLSQHDEQIGMMVVDTVGQILHKAANRSLVRHAVWPTSPNVREAAIAQLLHRDPDHYIGDLIDLMRPAEYGEAWSTVSGRLAHVRFMQDYDRNYVNFELVHRSTGAETIESRRLRNQQFDVVSSNNEFRLQNAHAALTRVTGENYGMDQRAWINWWKDFSYVRPGEYSSPQRSTLLSVDAVYSLSEMAGHSCFVAGTPVWTRRGLVPIDHVQLGELVLAKNVETGELAYQPVIDRTIRRQKPTLNLELDGETIGVTRGHPIWSVRRGWTRASDLDTGELLGTSGGSMPLDATSEGEADCVYNLVVAGNNTYFVGRHRILVHDITAIADLRLPSTSSDASGD